MHYVQVRQVSSETLQSTNFSYVASVDSISACGVSSYQDLLRNQLKNEMPKIRNKYNDYQQQKKDSNNSRWSKIWAFWAVAVVIIATLITPIYNNQLARCRRRLMDILQERKLKLSRKKTRMGPISSGTWSIEALLTEFIETCWEPPIAAIAEEVRQHHRTTLLRKTILLT